MKKRTIWIVCFMISFIYLMFASKCSFLYPMNDWVDANAFFTVGKGMAHGLVPFRDLFEQKGPLLYFFHMVAYLISNRSFIGVFFIEVLSFTILLYYLYHILKLYLKEEISLLVLPCIAMIFLTNAAFRMGDSAEEFIMPMLVYSLYRFLAYVKEDLTLTKKDFIVNGILAGSVLWIKYTMLGFWFAWMMCLFFEGLLQKKWKVAFQNCLFFLLGMLFATIPWVLYFGFHHAFYTFIEVYFFTNLNAYSHHVNIIQKLLLPFSLFIKAARNYPVTLWLLFLGGGFLLFSKEIASQKHHRVYIMLLLLCLIFTVYIGGFGFRYYFYIFMPFILFGIIGIISYFSIILKKKQLWVSFFLIFLLCFLFLLRLNENVKDLNKKKEDYAQYYFLEEIKKETNPTLLNYGFIDGGFYLTSGIVPNVRYFEKLNFKYENYPENIDEQNRYIKEQKVMFVVLQTKSSTQADHLEVPYLYDYYECVAEFIPNQGKAKNKYVLFKQKEA